MREDKKRLRLEYGRKLKSFIQETPAPVLREKQRALIQNLFLFLYSPAGRLAGRPLIIGAYQPLSGEPSPRGFLEPKPAAGEAPEAPAPWEASWEAFSRERPKSPPLRFAFPAIKGGGLAFYFPLKAAPFKARAGGPADAPRAQKSRGSKGSLPKKTKRAGGGEAPAYKKSRLSFLEPDPAKSEKAPLDSIDVFLLPGRAFDRRGARLGRGGGFYDKALAGRRGLRVGLAWDIQMRGGDSSGGLPLSQSPQGNLPVESHDALMDAIVTESFVLLPRLFGRKASNAGGGAAIAASPRFRGMGLAAWAAAAQTGLQGKGLPLVF